jgi:hypothetical protein
MSFKLIQTQTLASTAASIEFTSVPQNFTDLMFVVSARNDTTSVRAINLSFNGLSSDQSRVRLSGNGSGNGSTGSATSISSFNDIPGTAQAANIFGNLSIYIPNYSGSAPKVISMDGVGSDDSPTAWQTITTNTWNSTAAITSISVFLSSGNFLAETLVSLYGITKGSDGATTTTT